MTAFLNINKFLTLFIPHNTPHTPTQNKNIHIIYIDSKRPPVSGNVSRDNIIMSHAAM